MTLTARLSAAEVDALSKIDVGRAPLRAVVELGLIIGAAAALEATRAWIAWPVVALVIASRQHALLVLMHDCAHYRATRTRSGNNLLGEGIGWLFLMSMRGYRRHHQRHHVERNLNTQADPDFARMTAAGWLFPMTRSWLLLQLLRDVTLLNTHELMQEAKDARNNAIETRADAWWMVARVVFVVVLAVGLTALGAWRLYLIYWLLPTLTFLKAILRLRAIVDHFGLAEGAEPTRTVLAPWWERLLLAPCGIGIHHVHHAHGSIPYYRLKAAHRALSNKPGYLTRVRVSPSYLRALLEECFPKGVSR